MKPRLQSDEVVGSPDLQWGRRGERREEEKVPRLTCFQSRQYVEENIPNNLVISFCRLQTLYNSLTLYNSTGRMYIYNCEYCKLLN